jgi:hypothetical protein
MSGKMHNGVHALHDLGQPLVIRNIRHHQLETLDQEVVPARQVVVDNNLISVTPQGSRRMASYVSRSTHYQNHQDVSSPLPVVTILRLPSFGSQPGFARISRWAARFVLKPD